jgi:aryl-alcohol dehydrogenase-like predicted oxidoreductase
MLPLCLAEGIGVLPWSPLARGRLARAWETQPTTTRGQTDEYGKKLYSKTEEADRPVVDRLGEIAKARGISRAEIALAWLLHKPAVTAPIVGATKLQHLEEAAAAVDVKLSDAEIDALEAPYVTHPIAGFE